MLRGANILVTGSSRGLGLEMVKQLIARGDTNKIVATCRDPNTCPSLLELDSSSDKVHVLRLDVTKLNSFPDLANSLRHITEEQRTRASTFLSTMREYLPRQRRSTW